MKNIKVKKINKKTIVIISIVLVAIILVTAVICLVTKKDKNVEVENTGRIKKQAMNPNNYTMVKSKDGIDVPVPKGYTASSIDSEMYVNGECEESTIQWVDVSLTYTLAESTALQEWLGIYQDDELKWTKDENGIWKSGNTGIEGSISEVITNSFWIGAYGGKINVTFAVSSDTNDYFMGVICDTSGTPISESDAQIKASGTECGTVENELKYINQEIEITNEGEYMLILCYIKDEKIDDGLDRAYIKDIKLTTELAYALAYDNISNVRNEVIGKKQTTEGGFVIYEGNEEVTDRNKWEAQATRNQYVWIPIADVKDMYWTDSETDKIYGTIYEPEHRDSEGGVLSHSRKEGNKYEPVLNSGDKESSHLSRYMGGISRHEFLMQMEQEFYEMLQSVATYGGFYVGRYETGDLRENTPVVRKMNENLGIISWWDMYKKTKRISNDNSCVSTHMIWETQQFQVLKWLIDTGNKTCLEIYTDSSSFGNYRDITFTYSTSETSKATKQKDSYKVIPSGSYENAKTNNIYDLAGNATDFTMGTNDGLSRCGRTAFGGIAAVEINRIVDNGFGKYWDDKYSSYAGNNWSWNVDVDFMEKSMDGNDLEKDMIGMMGCRATLYIK